MINPYDAAEVWGAFVFSCLAAAIIALGITGIAYACGFFGKEP